MIYAFVSVCSLSVDFSVAAWTFNGSVNWSPEAGCSTMFHRCFCSSSWIAFHPLFILSTWKFLLSRFPYDLTVDHISSGFYGTVFVFPSYIALATCFPFSLHVLHHASHNTNGTLNTRLIHGTWTVVFSIWLHKTSSEAWNKTEKQFVSFINQFILSPDYLFFD